MLINKESLKIFEHKKLQLERVLGMVARYSKASAIQIQIDGQTLVSWGEQKETSHTMELGLQDSQYNERGLLKFSFDQEPHFDQGQMVQLEDCAALCSELLADEEIQHLEQMFDLAPIAIITAGADRCVQSWNQEAQRLFGYTEIEVIGKNLRSIIEMPNFDYVAYDKAILEDETISNLLAVCYAKDHRHVEISCNITPVRDVGGELVRLIYVVQNIGALRCQAEMLEQQRNFYESILDNIPAEIAVIDHNYNYVYLNPKGMRSSEIRSWMMGKNDYDYFEAYGGDLPLIDKRREYFQAATQNRKMEQWQETFNQPAGTRYRQRFANPVFKSNGDLQFIVGYSMNTTELKNAEEQRVKALLDYQTLFNYSSEGIFRSSMDGKLIKVNPAMARMMGYGTPEAFMADLELEPRDFYVKLGRYEEFKKLLISNGSVENFESEMYRLKNWKPMWVLENAQIVYDASGKALYYEGTIQDITERKIKERRLKMIERAVESSSDAITMLDTQLNVIYSNSAALQLFGYSTEELSNQSSKMISDDQITQIYSGVYKSGTWDGDLQLRTKDNVELLVHSRIDRIMDDHGKSLGSVSVTRDVSERKEIDRLKNELITTLSHELRTPLTSLKGALGLLAGGVMGDLGQATQNLIEIAFNNTERLSRRLSDIIDIDKLASGEMRLQNNSFNFTAALERAMVELGEMAQRVGCRIRFFKPQQDLFIIGDDERLSQVGMHLLSNAIKFSPQGESVEMHLLELTSSIRLEVWDCGPGISEAFAARIFERFSQEDNSDTRAQGGLGLGLAFSRAIVERHGGVIGYQVRSGGGSIFFVELPNKRVDKVVKPARR